MNAYPADMRLGFGLEIEVTAEFDPAVPLNEKVGTVPGFEVTADQGAQSMKSYPELREEPRYGGWREVLNDINDGAIVFDDALHDAGARKSPKPVLNTIPTAQQYRETRLKLSTPLPINALQSTGPVPEAAVFEMLQFHSGGTRMRAAVEAIVSGIEQRIQSIYPGEAPLSEDCRGFLGAVAYATLEGANRRTTQPVTPHSFFEFMHRACLSWRALVNVTDPRERGLVRIALQRLVPDRPSIICEALGKSGEEAFFNGGYLSYPESDGSVHVEAGPNVETVLSSIVNVTPEEPLDLMSRLPTYPKGKAGIGAMGSGDSTKKASLYEHRVVPIHGPAGALRPVAENEYRMFQSLAPGILSPIKNPSDDLPGARLLAQGANAIREVSETYDRYRSQVGDDNDPAMSFLIDLGTGSTSLVKWSSFLDELEELPDDQWTNLRSISIDLQACIDLGIASEDELTGAIDRVVEALHNVDAKGLARPGRSLPEI